ncbi:MAG TPA: heme-dependent oxidative N-demethylase subunit alpha family protein [Armatimonadota bacterium]|nr:heme-dependent oxidative N-demethylase subunit alpha family protein [Armatimonadota bacterium]
MARPALPAPARYFPARSGKYEVTAALRPLGTPYGNGEADARAFQLDARFAQYRENKLACRAERLPKYYGSQGYEAAVAAAVARFFVARLALEYPDRFSVEAREGGASTLRCGLTGESLVFDEGMRLCGVYGDTVTPPYLDAFDALCCQVQEDVAVIHAPPGGPDRLAAYHVCAPSHWSPEEKLGADFVSIHAPVPGIERVNRAAGTLVDAMVRRGPLVRFVWGIDTDGRLNRHPEPPPGVSLAAWQSPPFDPDARPPFFVRVERQVMWGLPEVDAALFLIRPYHITAQELQPDERAQLHSAISSMPAESRDYKGIAPYADELLRWLEQRPTTATEPAAHRREA